jgi:Cu+-exporting ATPase
VNYRLVAIAEFGSEHPLGQAVVNSAREKSIMISNPDLFGAVLGHGLEASMQIISCCKR